MIKRKFLLVSLILFIIVFHIHNTLALTANSSSYSVGMFGTGMATATPSSTNYESTALSEAKGTTRNAESGTYTANIGFFGNTTYHVTVSITSYTIYPTFAVQGSIISLSISALNSESVWAVLTLPNSSQETIALTNNGNAYYTADSIGTHTVTFYANSSSGSLASAIDTFEITSPVITPVTPPSGGGGGTTTIIEECSYIWDCSSWSICSGEIQERICKNIGDCVGTEEKPIEERICSDALFDVTIKFSELVITENNTLKFNIDLIEQEGIDKIDVQIKYSIIDKDNNEIFSQIETKAISRNLTFEKEIDEMQLADGEYILRVDILYGNLQRAFAEQKFEVKRGGLDIHPKEKRFINKLLIISGSVIILLILIIFVLIKRRKKKARKPKTHKKYKNKIKQNLRKIRSKNFLMAVAGFMLVGLLFIGGTQMTGFVVGSTNVVNDNWNIFGFVLVVGILGLLVFTHRKKIVEKIEIKRRNKHPKNSLNGLMKKKVYTGEGGYVGKVEEVLLEENRIDSLKIGLDKKQKFKIKGIVVKYNRVESIGHIVIINDKVLEHLNKPNNEKYKSEKNLLKIERRGKNEKEI